MLTGSLRWGARPIILLQGSSCSDFLVSHPRDVDYATRVSVWLQRRHRKHSSPEQAPKSWILVLVHETSRPKVKVCDLNITQCCSTLTLDSSSAHYPVLKSVASPCLKDRPHL
ncbi:uncharacterized protein LOC119597595 [Penaeus monodon]|uniref:uncharacterized protein LOC119597595 n=1 Tax=Penaeus monodon TaxID=6687 RepID=UPI0018A73ED8|nr:uncharacterized protein LOC119597595 [Penaeus monodon]